MAEGWKQIDNKTSLACALNGHRLCGSNCNRRLSGCAGLIGHCWTCNAIVKWVNEGNFIPIKYQAYNKDGTPR